MYQLSEDSIASWHSRKNLRGVYPYSIDLICPHCGRKVTFTVENWGGGSHHIWVSSVRCPACGDNVKFVMNRQPSDIRKLSAHEQLYVLPHPKVRQPIRQLTESDEFSESHVRAYKSVINAFNSREWASTAVMSRRLLEGVAQIKLDAKHHHLSLFDQLKKLPESMDLAEPILRLADGIRKGGNLGAHFDLEKEPNEEVSVLMLELIEDLIEYLFLLPERINELHEKIETLGAEPVEESPAPEVSESD